MYHCSVFCLRFGRHNEKITQIFFARQLSHDEAARKVCCFLGQHREYGHPCLSQLTIVKVPFR